MAKESRRFKCADSPEFAVWLEAMGGFIMAQPRTLSALLRLWEARCHAGQGASDTSPWSRAVSLAALRADHQLTDAEIRSFVDRGFIEFKLETTPAAPKQASSPTQHGDGDSTQTKKGKAKSRRPRACAAPPRRTFRKTAALRLTPSTCFVLSNAGVKMVCDVLSYFTLGRARSLERAARSDVNTVPEEREQEFDWDPRKGEWTLNKELIRDVAASAKRLRALLEAGKDVDFVSPIPSPFAHEHSNTKERVKHLSRELNVLNQHQRNRRVHLSSCDKGRAFQWKILV